MDNYLNKIPVEWRWVTIGRICVTSSGGTPDRKNFNYFKGDIPWVKSGELKYDVILKAEEYISKEALRSSSAKLFPKGSLLIALYGNTVGRMAFLGIDAATNQAIASITTFLINSKYVYYYLMSSNNALLSKREGSAQPNISQKVLNDFPFPLAPVEEQNRIVDKIEELFSEIDKNIAQFKISERKTKHIKSKLLDNYYKKHGAVDKSLSSLTLSVDYGFTAKSYTGAKDNNSIFYLRITDIQNGKIDWEKVPYCDANIEDLKKYQILENDILFARSGNTVGKTVLVKNPPKSLYASYLIRIRCDIQKILPEYLSFFFQSNLFWTQINDGVTGIGQPNFNGSKVSELKIPVVSLEEQQKIIMHVEHNFAEVDKLQDELKVNLAKTELLKSKILFDAFNGNLTKQYDTDSSVDELLNKIESAKSGYQVSKSEISRNLPKLKKMEKSTLSLLEVLEKNSEPITVKKLWQDSMYIDNIEQFYSELKKIQNKIKQEKHETEVLVSKL
ncbi:restriction endonuclease subunit S [Pedobacter cryotolerans]|uniref:Type I restriction modification DNA specificity domain-containing protein n=1 Tax=Pedobacter cryotolerans TaxID=2571270 RepID=A0A4V5NY02_9SPHI|nr:restriction endonuclease subunit S [Pedobacter cryotolerans]TKC01403.1 hypothetical protein FA045_09205 [Pedobacter cryotolerans]